MVWRRTIVMLLVVEAARHGRRMVLFALIVALRSVTSSMRTEQESIIGLVQRIMVAVINFLRCVIFVILT